jgi:undecaprenyl diphosphate synthase
MATLPQHIALIMDGNGRWAKKRLMPRQVGHVKGAAAARRIVQACADRDIHYVTLFAFSTENWRRPPDEVSALMDLFVHYLQKEMREMSELGVRLRVIGDRSPFDTRLQALINEAETATAGNTKLHLTIAANYGGQWDILQAMRAWQQAHPGQSLDALNEQALASHLSMAGLPDPELLIRTGGESRISNFLLWQMAYSELYFTPTLWPDFDEQALDQALAWFGQRVRRFGQTDEQVLNSA